VAYPNLSLKIVIRLEIEGLGCLVAHRNIPERGESEDTTMSKSCLDQLDVWGPEYGNVYNLYLDFVIPSNLMKLSSTEVLMVLDSRAQKFPRFA